MKEFSLILRSDRSKDKNRYNLPTNNNEIAFIFVSDNGEPPDRRDIQIHPKSLNNKSTTQIDITNPNLDTIVNTDGEHRWYPKRMVKSYLDDSEHKITMLKWKAAQISLTPVFNPLFHTKMLYHQWLIDSYINVESNNLNYLRRNQKKLRIEKYQGILDHLTTLETNVRPDLGKQYILPSSFSGSSRNLRERYMDAMTSVAKFGRPDLFITFTCNPNWVEIKESKFENQQSNDRPELIDIVFELKLKEIIKDIVKIEIFGTVIDYTYTVEFQKRGLPLAHMLFFLDKQYKIFDSSKVVFEELPNPIEEPELYKIVKKYMFHVEN